MPRGPTVEARKRMAGLPLPHSDPITGGTGHRLGNGFADLANALARQGRPALSAIGYPCCRIDRYRRSAFLHFCIPLRLAGNACAHSGKRGTARGRNILCPIVPLLAAVWGRDLTRPRRTASSNVSSI